MLNGTTLTISMAIFNGYVTNYQRVEQLMFHGLFIASICLMGKFHGPVSYFRQRQVLEESEPSGK